MHTRQYDLLILLCASMLSQCKPEPKMPEMHHLLGVWEVKSAARNHRPTGLLAGTYFVFSDNNTMVSNLPLTESLGEWQTNFELVKDSLFQKGIPNEQYHIKAWSDSTLSLEFATRGIPFHLDLRRSSLEKIHPVSDTIQ